MCKCMCMCVYLYVYSVLLLWFFCSFVCFVLFFLLLPVCFLVRERKGLDLDLGGWRRGDVRGVEAEETVIRIHCMKK